MVDLVTMATVLANLKVHFGCSGAINQLLQALRNGELTGICDQFHGRNASNLPIYELPDKARNLALPMLFWGHVQWQKDGETLVEVANQPFDPWIFNADWRNGNFCVSGSRARGRKQIIRNARCVRLTEAEAEAFFVKRGIVSEWSISREDGPRTPSQAVARVNRRPGPKPDCDWPKAIAEVTQQCIEAGYKHPLKRGDKTAIQTLLLNWMADRDKHFSNDTAAKYANVVLEALPDG